MHMHDSVKTKGKAAGGDQAGARKAMQSMTIKMMTEAVDQAAVGDRTDAVDHPDDLSNPWADWSRKCQKPALHEPLATSEVVDECDTGPSLAPL